MAPLLDDDFVWNRAVHSRRISFLPRKCYISGESLWLKKAWRCRFYDWSGEEDEWYSERAYLWKKLKVG
jgi:hypothetical protein